MHRRTLLSTLGAGAVALAGCTGASGDPAPTDLPEGCPTTQDLGVEWPDDLDADAVASFVEAYEHAYYREKVVEYDPDSRLASYELSGSVVEGPNEREDGWEVAYSGSGGIYRPTLALGATPAEPPADADVVPQEDIDDEPVVDVLREAVETGQAEYHVDSPGETVDDYADTFASLSADFESLSGRGDGDTLYVDVDGTTVTLDVHATDFHGDYWWEAWYYVDEHVVRRTDEEGTDPRDGDPLECRESV